MHNFIVYRRLRAMGFRPVRAWKLSHNPAVVRVFGA